ncbi:MAG: hypothetical protein ACLFU8_10480 [Anaerolineales bacterium]
MILSLSLLSGCGARTSGFSWRTVGWIAVILGLLVGVLLLMPLIRRWQRRHGQRRYRLEIRNEGNVRSRYALEADAPPDSLNFVFTVNGTPLHGRLITTTTDAPAPQPSAAPTAAPREGGGPAAGLQKAKQVGGVVGGLSGTISTVLISIGNLLPYSAGLPFIRLGSKLRRGQSSVDRVGQTGSAMKRQAGRTKVRAPSGRSGRQAAPPPPPGGASTISGTASALVAMETEWVETPFVEPGGVLTLDLLVQPENPYRPQHVPFTLRSRSLEWEGAPVVAEETLVRLAGLTPFQKFGPFILLAVGAILVLLGASLLLGG